MTERKSATAFAPASVANVAVGFDMLGYSVSPLGDRVTARRIPGTGVRIGGITGCESALPLEVERNTAGRAAAALLRHAGASFGVELDIDKGIPLESGLGGSAASAVAAVVAANALLPSPLDVHTLLRFALRGEEAASGAPHWDNIAPAMLGGLVLVVGSEPPQIRPIPVPPGLKCVVVHPHIKVATRYARSILSPTVPMADWVRQQSYLAGFLAGCYTGDLAMIRASLHDIVVEPQRKGLIRGFEEVKARALAEGAVGCSIAGAGPTVFAWCEESSAAAVRSAMVDAFARTGSAADSWISCIGGASAHLVEEP